MRRIALLILALTGCVSASPAETESPDSTETRCWNNADCSDGHHCFIPEGAIQGMCGEKVDELGMPDHSVPMPTDAEETDGCFSDTDCPVLLRCKKLDALHGVCVKR